ncbi:MAG: hypothetical protein ABIM89_17710 [Mycobacteriales bacterium]
MDRRQLESAGESFPHTHVQGLYAVPFGVLLWFFVALGNVAEPPGGRWIVRAGIVLAALLLWLVTFYYRRSFGRVTPTRDRQIRYVVAAVVAFAVFAGVDQILRAFLGRPPEPAVSTTLSAWAAGMIVFYLVAGSLRAHHLIIWSAMFVAGLLPIWGHGIDRDALAYFPIGTAMIVTGLFDHRDLLRTFRAYHDLHLETTDVRG